MKNIIIAIFTLNTLSALAQDYQPVGGTLSLKYSDSKIFLSCQTKYCDTYDVVEEDKSGQNFIGVIRVEEIGQAAQDLTNELRKMNQLANQDDLETNLGCTTLKSGQYISQTAYISSMQRCFAFGVGNLFNTVTRPFVGAYHTIKSAGIGFKADKMLRFLSDKKYFGKSEKIETSDYTGIKNLFEKTE